MKNLSAYIIEFGMQSAECRIRENFRLTRKFSFNLRILMFIYRKFLLKKTGSDGF